MLGGLIPRPEQFAKRLVLIKGARVVQNVCDGLGRERMAWHIANNVSLADTAPPRVKEYVRSLAAQYSWAAAAISNDDFKAMLPGWLTQMVAANGEGGEEWLEAQIRWLRELFGGGDAAKMAG